MPRDRVEYLSKRKGIANRRATSSLHLQRSWRAPMRRAALEAVEPDIETVRRELVRRAVDAEKASGDAAAPRASPSAPPPRPADEGAAAALRSCRASSGRRGPSTRRSGSSRPWPMLRGRRRPIARKWSRLRQSSSCSRRRQEVGT